MPQHPASKSPHVFATHHARRAMLIPTSSAASSSTEPTGFPFTTTIIVPTDAPLLIGASSGLL